MPRRLLARLLRRLDRSPLPLSEKVDLEAELLELQRATTPRWPIVNVAFVGEA